MDDYETCYECSIYGDDYGYDENGEIICYCQDCIFNKYIDESED